VKPRRPDFFIAGHPKCGTTALYAMLRRHPAIFMPALKEPMFLASDLAHVYRSPMLGPLPETLDEYLGLFAGAGPEMLAGEASSFYVLSKTAAEAIGDLNPNARVVAVFREPAAFLRSFHAELLKHHVEDRPSLRRALELEPERRAGKRVPRRASRPPLLLYSEHVRYADQLRRLRGAVGSTNVLPVVYDDFHADNRATAARVLAFLGVEDDGLATEPLRANVTEAVTRHLTLETAVRRVSVGYGRPGRTARVAIKTLVPRRTRRWALVTVSSRVVRRPPEPVDERLAAEIRSRFRPEVEALGELLERDLAALWGYDS
jgi:hypothetical protein